MFDKGDISLECLIEETSALNVCLYQTFKTAVSSIKHSRLLCPLSNIQGCCLLSNMQGCCLLYQSFKTAVSSIKHSGLLSPLSNIQVYSRLECLIEETVALNV
jgi:hypothetical protein